MSLRSHPRRSWRIQVPQDPKRKYSRQPSQRERKTLQHEEIQNVMREITIRVCTRDKVHCFLYIPSGNLVHTFFSHIIAIGPNSTHACMHKITMQFDFGINRGWKAWTKTAWRPLENKCRDWIRYYLIQSTIWSLITRNVTQQTQNTTNTMKIKSIWMSSFLGPQFSPGFVPESACSYFSCARFETTLFAMLCKTIVCIRISTKKNRIYVYGMREKNCVFITRINPR